MRSLFVAAKHLESREWIPVAELLKHEDGYELRYLLGAERLPGFTGLSRMQSLEKSYRSKNLFPFFSNRILSKSRPEYQNFLRWLGKEELPSNPMEMLAVTGGARATDDYELFAHPKLVGGSLELEFFPRGLRHYTDRAVQDLLELSINERVYLLRDVQNGRDPDALAIRSEKPYQQLIGYVPRYYCKGIGRLLDNGSGEVKGTLKRVNRDAPKDMKVLVSFTAEVAQDFNLLSGMDDFKPFVVSRDRASA